MLVTPVWFLQGIVMATKKEEAARAAIVTVAAPVAGPAAAKKLEPAAALSGTEKPKPSEVEKLMLAAVPSVLRTAKKAKMNAKVEKLLAKGDVERGKKGNSTGEVEEKAHVKEDEEFVKEGEKKDNAKMIDEGKKGEADGTAEELQSEAKEKEAGQGMPEAKEKKDKAEEERGEKEKKRGEAKEKTVADEEKKDEAKEDAAERPPFPAGMHCTIRPLHPPPPTLALPFGRESNSNGAFPSLPLHLACHNNSRLPFCRDNAALQLVAG